MVHWYFFYDSQDKQRLFPYTDITRSGDNSIVILTDYGLDGRGIRDRFPAGTRFFFSTASKPDLCSANSPIQLVLGALSPGVKRPEREADQSPHPELRLKIGGTIPQLPHTVYLHGVVLNW
jgi:hypothetical protein